MIDWLVFGKKIIYQEAPETLPPEILKSMKRDIAKRILSERKENGGLFLLFTLR